MHFSYVELAAWIFQLGLFVILSVTLVYTRRLNRILIQVRTDHEALQTILPQFDASISAAVTATDRLVHKSSEADAALKVACASAETMIRKLNESMNWAAQTTLSKPLETIAPHPSSTTLRPLTQRRPAKPQSRVERDLARMLLDAS